MALFAAVPATQADTKPDTLVFDTDKGNNVNISYDSITGVYTVNITGGDPYAYFNNFTQDLHSDNMVLSFEYKSETGITGNMQFFLGEPVIEARSTYGGTLTATSDWKTYSCDLTDIRTSLVWGSAGDVMRMDFGTASGKTIMMRNIVMRPRNTAELDSAGVTDSPYRNLCVMKNNSIVYTIPLSKIDSIGVSNRMSLRVYDSNGKNIQSIYRMFVDSIVFHDYDSYPTLNANITNDLTCTYDINTQEYTINTTGGDPYIYTNDLYEAIPDSNCVLEFQYKSSTGISDPIQIFFGNTISESRSIKLDPLSKSSVWQTFSINLKSQRELYDWGKNGQHLRIDIGSGTGQEVVIRGLRFRTMTAAEKEVQDQKDSVENAKLEMDSNLLAYLSDAYPDTITYVSVTSDSVTITGTISGSGDYALAEVTPYDDVTEETNFENRTALSDSNFTVTLKRRLLRGGVYYDRALSKWAIVKTIDGKDTLMSHAHYADTVAPTYVAAEGKLLGKKGIAAGNGDIYIADFDSLQAHSITMNIVLSAVMQLNKTSGNTAYMYGGKTYYINTSEIERMDKVLKAAYKKDIIVSGILLATSDSYFKDPECEGGYYTMPNMTTPEAVNRYAAVLNYLAKRYSKGTYGRIHHWIMHNEVDMGSTWTNMGNQPVNRYLDRYIKSMRMCYNIVRQYDQHASVLGSYTHGWIKSSGEYQVKYMLEQTVKYSNAEGDFLWGIAYHPYPKDLTKPEFWKNDLNSTSYTKNADYCTFLNPEVINDWILDKSHFYKGEKKRVLFFSEQGTNSPTYSSDDLAKQAAGAAWMWKKLEKLDGIDAMQWHNWMDNPDEFGLRIGLRAFDDESAGYSYYDPKPVWYVWQAAGTDKEDEVFEPYLDVIGISSWDNIVQTIK